MDSVPGNEGFACPWTQAEHQENQTCNNNEHTHLTFVFLTDIHSFDHRLSPL